MFNRLHTNVMGDQGVNPHIVPSAHSWGCIWCPPVKMAPTDHQPQEGLFQRSKLLRGGRLGRSPYYRALQQNTVLRN